ncbi:hypothetical protein ACTHPH_06555 [Paenibacillus pasadenensis]|uniref:hypothetical protein n=1 Tax=Paenibacillus pasadenensis TaxID=217090 RepID=UPI00069369F9|nr:hypothetical protein [Paenibacillus pasadenensis]
MKKKLQDPTKLVLRPSTSVHKSREALPASMLTIINTKRCGKRVAVAEEVKKKLGDPVSIQIAFDDEGILLGENLGLKGDCRFTLRASGKKAVIYSSQLAEEITSLFGLDFSNKTSISFQGVTYLEYSGRPAAYIDMTQQASPNDDDRGPDNDVEPEFDAEDESDDDLVLDTDGEPDDEPDPDADDSDDESDEDDESDDDLVLDTDGWSDDELDPDDDDESDDYVDTGTEGDTSEDYQPLAITRHKRGRIS